MSKKFKETKVGKFLSNVAPKLLDGVGDILPNNGALGILKNVISKDDTIPQQDKDIALELLKLTDKKPTQPLQKKQK